MLAAGIRAAFIDGAAARRRMQIETVAVAALREREDFLFVAEVPDDSSLFQPTRDEPNRLSPLELIDHAEADQVIESYFYRQCAAASPAIVTETLVVTMPGI